MEGLPKVNGGSTEGKWRVYRRQMEGLPKVNGGSTIWRQVEWQVARTGAVGKKRLRGRQCWRWALFGEKWPAKTQMMR